MIAGTIAGMTVRTSDATIVGMTGTTSAAMIVMASATTVATVAMIGRAETKATSTCSRTICCGSVCAWAGAYNNDVTMLRRVPNLESCVNSTRVRAASVPKIDKLPHNGRDQQHAVSDKKYPVMKHEAIG